MAADEGMRRIKILGRDITLYGGSAGLCLWIAVRLMIGDRIRLGELFFIAALGGWFFVGPRLYR